MWNMGGNGDFYESSIGPYLYKSVGAVCTPESCNLRTNIIIRSSADPLNIAYEITGGTLNFGSNEKTISAVLFSVGGILIGLSVALILLDMHIRLHETQVHPSIDVVSVETPHPVSTVSTPSVNSHPFDWTQFNAEDGKPYWYSSTTGVTTWDNPHSCNGMPGLPTNHSSPGQSANSTTGVTTWGDPTLSGVTNTGTSHGPNGTRLGPA